ncbi:hypothetical protein ACHAXR_008139 [Thalassiosira sp. AJA248-18]
MTTRAVLLLFNILALFCIIAVVLRSNNNRNQQQQSLSQPQSQPLHGLETTTRQTKHQSPLAPNNNNNNNKMKRNMVGGYSNMDIQFLQSEEVLDIANFALNEHAAGSSSTLLSSSSLAVTPEEVESGVVQLKVLEAQRQVVAGLNYRLTLAIFKDQICQGAFKVVVYKPLPHMEQGLTVTSWGKNVLECSDIADLLDAIQGKEEEVALLVEKERKEEVEELEPDA